VLAAVTANARATRLFGVVPIPARVRRAGGLPARTLLVLLVLVIDVTVLTVGEVQRLHHVRRRSLLPFTRAVEEALPAAAALYAGDGVDGSDVQVLAYRLRRPITRTPSVPIENAEASATYYVIPAPHEHALDARLRVIVQSGRRGPNLALVTASADAPVSR